MKNPNPVYLDHNEKLNYPSGSTISYLDGRFYIMGDDASDILVLNDQLKEIERIQLFTRGQNVRTPKATKADIESSVVITKEGVKSILFLGSGSLSPHRDKAFLFNPNNKKSITIDLTGFYNQLRANLSQLNIEAATMIGDDLVLGIRANASHPENFFVLSSVDAISPAFKRKILINMPVKGAGISGMDYDQEHDMLFVTFSTENTSDSFLDGAIGESYLAIITDARKQFQKTEFNIPSLTKLANLSPDFSHQKIESVTLVRGKRQLLLVADDDLGETRLFEVGF